MTTFSHTITHQQYLEIQKKLDEAAQRHHNDYIRTIYRLDKAIVGITSQQVPQANTKLTQPASSNGVIFSGKNENCQWFGHLLQTMLRLQPQMSEPKKINHFSRHFQTRARKMYPQ